MMRSFANAYTRSVDFPRQYSASCYRTLYLFSIIILSLFGSPALGDEDQDWALEAVRSGKAVSLANIMSSLEQTFQGQVYEVTLEREDNVNMPSLYRISLVTRDGKFMEILINTTTGEPVGVGGQGIGEGQTGQ